MIQWLGLSSALACGMALIAVDAVVDVARHAFVLEIVGIISAMTSSALEDRVVIRIGVASGADVVGIPVTGRELGVLRVVERRVCPGTGVVAVLAGSREELRLRRVAGIRGLVVVALMATDTGCRQCGVVIVDVAVGAFPRWRLVRSRQRECRVVVIEG